MVLKSDIQTAYLSQQTKLRYKPEFVSREKYLILKHDNSFIQVISGVRRCGKSTLLHLIMAQYGKVAYFNFEDPRINNFEVEDFIKLDDIMPHDVEAYFFDEIQNVDKWELYVRQLHDDNKKVYITGSNASLLSKDLGTRLTGRYLNTELFTFSYQEFLLFKKLNANEQTAKKYLAWGGFPDYLKDNNPEILQNLFKDILLRDIAIRYGIRNTKTLLDIALFLISNIGKETTYNSLKNSFQVGSTNTVVDYLTWMEDAYLLFFLQKFSYSTKKMMANPRKVYAIDNGLIACNSLSFSDDHGRKLENAVFIHLKNQGKKLYYFKEKGECDFVIFENEKSIDAIQVCYEINADNKTREISGLLEALDFFKLNEGKIITFNQQDVLKFDHKTIYLIPCHKYFMK